MYQKFPPLFATYVECCTDAVEGRGSGEWFDLFAVTKSEQVEVRLARRNIHSPNLKETTQKKEFQ
jgi:hypothetical protein